MFQLSEFLVFPFFTFHARFLIGGFSGPSYILFPGPAVYHLRVVEQNSELIFLVGVINKITRN